jgi:hypothetical protein
MLKFHQGETCEGIIQHLEMREGATRCDVQLRDIGHHTSPDARVEMTLGRTSAPIKPHRVQTIREQRDRTDVSSDLSALITIQIRVRSPRLEQSGGVMELIGDLGKKLTELTLLEGRVFRPQGSNLDQRVR